jgi:hypothetical protein
MFKDSIDRRNFIKLVGAGAAALALPSLVVAETDPYRQMGFMDRDLLTYGDGTFIEKQTLYFKENPREGWLTVTKYADGWKPGRWENEFKHLPHSPWFGYWTPQETGYVTQWSEYARSEAELIRLLRRRFGCQPYTLW